MFTINLEKKLTKTTDVALEEAKRILEKATSDDLQTLRNAGFRNSAEIANTYKSHKNYKNGRVFTRNQIKDVACKYGLRFLETVYYKGNIPADLPQTISEFKKQYDTNKFFILAPAESFELQSVPKDPLLFGKIGEDAYYLIRKWGNDLSIWRLISNYRYRDEKHFIRFRYLWRSALLIVLWLTEYFLIKNYTYNDNVMIFPILIGALTLGVSGVIWIGITGFYSWDRDKLNSSLWNSRYFYE